MRRISKKAWLVIGVVAVLCISGGIIYAAYDEHTEGVKISGDGIGMNTTPPDDPRTIEGPAEGVRIKGGVKIAQAGIGMNCDPPADPEKIEWSGGRVIEGYSSPGLLRMRTSAANSKWSTMDVNYDGANSSHAFMTVWGSEWNPKARVAARSDSDDYAYMRAYGNGYTQNARVEVHSDGYAFMESKVSDAAVEVTEDGDVIITLGN